MSNILHNCETNASARIPILILVTMKSFIGKKAKYYPAFILFSFKKQSFPIFANTNINYYYFTEYGG